jgi:hypothetical protein
MKLFTRQPFSRKRMIGFWALGICTVFLAFSAIHFSSRRTINLRIKSEFEDIGEATTEELSGHQTKSTSLLIGLRIASLGEPTIVEGGQLTMTLPNGAEIKLMPTSWAGKITLNLESGALSFPASEMLFNKIPAPLFPGAVVRGVLAYSAPALTREDVLAARRGKITLLDTEGAAHAVVVDWSTAVPR